MTRVTHRAAPVYLGTVTGKPPTEDAVLGKAVERVFLPVIRLVLPEIVDMNLPMEGLVHQRRDRLDPEAVPRTTRAR